MTRAEVRELLARLSPDARQRVSAATIAAVHAEADKAQLRVSYAPYASKWEREYAERLAVLTLVGEVTAWNYEPCTLTALGGTRYTPDFGVRFPDGREEFHEVKGYLRSRDAVRMRECRAVSPLPIVVMTKRNGVWVEVRRYAPGNSKPNEAKP